MAEERPHTCFANKQSAEVEGVESGLITEILVCTAEITFLAGEGYEIAAPHPVAVTNAVELFLQTTLLFAQFGFALWQRGDTCLVGMRTNGVVGHTYGYPVSAFPACPLTNKIHHPYLVRVTNGERLAFRSVAVLVDEGDHPLDRLTGCFRSLKRNVDKRTVVHTHGVPQFLASAPGGLTDGDLVLVGVTDYRIGVSDLRDLSLRTTRIPVFHFAHRTFRPVLCRREMQKTVHAIRVSRIGNHRAAIRRSVLAHEEIRAGLYS